MITAEPTFKDDTVYFKAIVFPDSKNKDRFFNGHSFGSLKGEKALEKLETVAVGRALAFMGIGIVESIASSDEMANFQNKFNSETEKIPVCDICGSAGIKVRWGWTCPAWKQHKEKGEKFKLIHKSELPENMQKFSDSLEAIK